MIIPQGNNVVRVYVQLISPAGGEEPRKLATESKVQQAANDILSPYHIEWERVDWYSAYPIGQGIAERYTLDERIFMGGDACHTHSV
jgi:2-polyprenyl-6-methoxyphenol hydroxylase-like FAD-dependent oxidoreductase